MVTGKDKQLYQKTQVELQNLKDFIRNYGFNPVTMIPFKAKSYTEMLSSKDRLMCASRYDWKLPINLRSQQLEAMFYQFFSLCVFEDWEHGDGEITFARYTRIGDLNKYGELQYIQPIDFSGKVYGKRKCVLNATAQPKENEGVAVIINDYTPTLIGEDIGVPRAKLNLDTTINDQVQVYSQLMTNITLSVKKALALCESEEQVNVVMQQAKQLLNPTIPLVAVSSQAKSAMGQPVQMFNFGNNFDTQNYCQTIEFYDKVRRGFDGVPAPDVFEKKERMITTEAENNGVDTDLVLQDGYKNRKDSIELFKKYAINPKNKEVSVEISEALKPKEVKQDELPNDNKDSEAKANIRE